jgi:hypothetical protein
MGGGAGVEDTQTVENRWGGVGLEVARVGLGFKERRRVWSRVSCSDLGVEPAGEVAFLEPWSASSLVNVADSHPSEKNG